MTVPDLCGRMDTAHGNCAERDCGCALYWMMAEMRVVGGSIAGWKRSFMERVGWEGWNIAEVPEKEGGESTE